MERDEELVADGPMSTVCGRPERRYSTKAQWTEFPEGPRDLRSSFVSVVRSKGLPSAGFNQKRLDSHRGCPLQFHRAADGPITHPLRHLQHTHLALSGANKNCTSPPEPRPVQSADAGEIVAIPEVGGLHHRYERRMAAKSGRMDFWEGTGTTSAMRRHREVLPYGRRHCGFLVIGGP